MTDSYLAPAPAPRQLDIIADTALAHFRPELSTKPKRESRPELSTEPKRESRPELSTDRMKRVEARRRQIGVSVSKLVFSADLSRDTYFAACRGKSKTRLSTIQALEKALDRFATGNGAASKLTLHESYLVNLTIQLAQRAGWDPELMLSQDFSSENTNDPVWLQASRIRRCAIYLMVEGLRCSKADMGRLIGVSRQAIHKSVAAIEVERDRDQQFHIFMGGMMLQVVGKRL